MEENNNRAENENASEIERNYSQEGTEERYLGAQEAGIPLSHGDPVAPEPLIQPNQYGQGVAPDATTQQGQQYWGGASGETASIPVAPYADPQSFYSQPLTSAHPNEQYYNQQNQQHYAQQYGQAGQNYGEFQQGYQQEHYQQGPDYSNPQPRQRTSKMAIASLIVGGVAAVMVITSIIEKGPLQADEYLLFFAFIFANMGLIFGLASRKKTKNEKALMGIVLNQFLMLFIASLMAIIINYLKQY